MIQHRRRLLLAAPALLLGRSAEALVPFPTSLFGALCVEDTSANTLSACKRTADIALSAAKLTASSAFVNSTGGGSGVRGLKGRSSGKPYFEFNTGTAGTVAGNPMQYGVCTAAAALGNAPTDAAFIEDFGPLLRCQAAGVAYGTSGGFASFPSTSGIVGVCLDFSAGLIWIRSYDTFGAEGGHWNVALNGDPAAGTGGITLSGLTSSTLYPFIGMRRGADGGSAGFMGTFNPTSTVVHAAPAGFTAGW